LREEVKTRAPYHSGGGRVKKKNIFEVKFGDGIETKQNGIVHFPTKSFGMVIFRTEF